MHIKVTQNIFTASPIINSNRVSKRIGNSAPQANQHNQSIFFHNVTHVDINIGILPPLVK